MRCPCCDTRGTDELFPLVIYRNSVSKAAPKSLLLQEQTEMSYYTSVSRLETISLKINQLFYFDYREYFLTMAKSI